MRAKKFLFYLLAALIGGCVPSIHSLFTEKDLIFEENLVGVWADPNSQSQESWQFKQTANKKYELIYTDEKGKEGKFLASLGKLNGIMFLDIFPGEELKCQTNDFYNFHFLPVHTFIKIEQIQPILKMRMMDPDEMKRVLAKDPNVVRYELAEDRLVLTSSTKELQAFVIKYANDERLFRNETILNRKKISSAEPSDKKNPNDPNQTSKESRQK